MSEEELIEKIRALLPSVETAQIDPEASPADTACAKCLEKDLLLQRCLESLRWKTEGDPPVDVWVLFFRHSTGEYMVDIPDKDEMPGEWKRGGWTHWLPIPQ